MFRSSSRLWKSLKLVGAYLAVTAACDGPCGGDSTSPAIPESLDVTPSSLSLDVDQSAQITAVVRGCDGVISVPVGWSSAQSSIASVDAAGVVTGRAGGSTSVTASAGSLSRNVAVTVSEGPIVDPLDPVAAFTHNCNGLNCAFTDISTDADGTIQSWSWSFGDGASSSSENPTHLYAAGGTYSVGLTVTDNDGNPGSTSNDIVVTEGPPPPSGAIVFVSNRSGTENLFTIEPDGSGLTQLTNKPLSSFGGPQWSPDGSRIVLSNGGFVITVKDDGTDEQELHRGNEFYSHPTYSPDGQRIAF